MIWKRLDGEPVDEVAIDSRLDSAVAEIVQKQREAAIDVVSDGEMSKTGFSTYVGDRFSGFEGCSEFQADGRGRLAVEALNAALEGIPPEKVRFHVCWCNYGGPHHTDAPLRDIIEQVYKVNAGTMAKLPDDKSIILGAIDVKSNYIEHPQVVADRLVRLAKIVGKDRVMGGTDCGFDTFIRFSLVDPKVAWLKLQSLAEGAEPASSQV
jgi:5-methyltetrahydropteroyltriglutamate--homocysteine methyltransferase